MSSPTEESLQFEIPKPSYHSGAMAEIPADVTEQWKKTYAEAYLEAVGDSGDGQPIDEAAIRRMATGKANKRHIRVQEPKSYDDALAIPEWQLMLRENIYYKDLPLHAQREIRDTDGRKSGTYLRVYTTDGREYFFAAPEKTAA